MTSPDALGVDNEAFAVIPPPRPVRVLLVSKGNWFLEGLLHADNQMAFDQLAPESFQPDQAVGFDVTVFDDVLPEVFGKSLGDLPKGNFLFLHRAPLPTESAEELTRPR